MFNNLRGWKRKSGLVTLALACVFTAGWVRSNLVYDFASVVRTGTGYTFGSLDGEFKLIRTVPPYVVRVPWGWESGKLSNLTLFTTEPAGVRKRIDLWKDHQVVWRFDWLGIHSGCGVHDGTKREIFTVPYMVVVVPLALLSTWLLLSNVRQPMKPEPSQEPVA